MSFDILSLRAFIKGLLSYTPIKQFVVKKGTGGTNSGRYCYNVWLRHLSILFNNGMEELPKSMAELGPGDSLGVGLASLLTGVGKYYAFDVIKHLENKNNLTVLDEIYWLFRSKSSILLNDEFPELRPELNDYSFPNFLDTECFWENIQSRYLKIKNELLSVDNNLIEYIVPWNFEKNVNINSIDLIISQAVMEHVTDIDNAYKIMYNWLRKGGYMSHQIDFRAHETHKVWNGHWKYSDFSWEIIMHGRSYPINRLPFSRHINAIKLAGFEIVKILTETSTKGFKRNQLNKRFSDFEENDYFITNAHILAKK